MVAPLRVTLTTEEKRTLQELRIASSVPYRVRDRAHMLLLNASGRSAPAIAEIMDCHEPDWLTKDAISRLNRLF